MSTSTLEPTDNKNTIPAPPPLEGVYGTTFAEASTSVFAAIKVAADQLAAGANLAPNQMSDLLSLCSAYEVASRGYVRAHRPIFSAIPEVETNAGSNAPQEGAGQ
jgi:hypothetical protein